MGGGEGRCSPRAVTCRTKGSLFDWGCDVEAGVVDWCQNLKPLIDQIEHLEFVHTFIINLRQYLSLC